jgi:succinylarginine dihydrolase
MNLDLLPSLKSSLEPVIKWLIRLSDQNSGSHNLGGFAATSDILGDLFNSQLVQTSGGKRILVAPSDAEENHKANAVIEGLTGSAFDQVIFMNLRQSMRNGGGPACLRLSVVLTPTELAQVHP